MEANKIIDAVYLVVTVRIQPEALNLTRNKLGIHRVKKFEILLIKVLKGELFN